MTRRIHVLVALLLSAVSCSGDEATHEAQVFPEDAVSLVPPDGWRVKHEKGTLVFVGGSSDEDTQAVIAIRAVSVAAWNEPRTAENVLPSVKTVLEALPGARVEGPRELEHPAYRALAFDVVFTPRSKRGKRYQRRHVVVEANQHIYHALLTAPADQIEQSLPTFDRVLASLREEV